MSLVKMSVFVTFQGHFRDSAGVKLLAFIATNPVFILTSTYGPQTSPEAIPEPDLRDL